MPHFEQAVARRRWGGVRLRLLGDVAIECGSDQFVLPRSGERCVLATLAFEAARPVRIGTLVEHIWGVDNAPANAEATVATYVRSVRRLIERAGGDRDWLRNRRPGAYELRVELDRVDYHLFQRSVALAETSCRDGDVAGAVRHYEQGLDLWHGEPLANVDGDWAERCRYTLRQEWLDATCALLDLRLRMGQYAEVAVSAQQVAQHYPTERVVTLALRGLAYSGQQAMVADFTTRVAARMDQVAGVRPRPELVALARRLAAEGAETLKPEGPIVTARPTVSDRVIMSAGGNQQVWQAAGDQYIIER